MRLTLLSIVGAAALATTLTACGKSGGGGGSAASCTPVDPSITVEALDKLQFDATSYEAGAGCVEITYKNQGSIAHTLLIKGKSEFKLSVGTSDTGTITLPAGTYTLYCDVSGHEAAGMEATLKVS